MSIRQIGQLDSIDSILATDKLIVQKDNMAHGIPANSALELLGNVEIEGLNTDAQTLIGAINELYIKSRGVNAVWIGTQAEYDAILIKDGNTVYIVLLGAMISRVYFGYAKVYPTDFDYDYLVTDQTFNADRYIDTGLALYSQANISRNWKIDVDFTIASADSDKFIMGFGRNTGSWANTWNVAVKSGYTNSSYYHGLNNFNTSEQNLGTTVFQIVKTGANISFYDSNDTLITTILNRFTSTEAATHTMKLGGGTTNNDGVWLAYFKGTINKFGFKWL